MRPFSPVMISSFWPLCVGHSHSVAERGGLQCDRHAAAGVVPFTGVTVAVDPRADGAQGEAVVGRFLSVGLAPPEGEGEG